MEFLRTSLPPARLVVATVKSPVCTLKLPPAKATKAPRPSLSTLVVLFALPTIATVPPLLAMIPCPPSPAIPEEFTTSTSNLSNPFTSTTPPLKALIPAALLLPTAKLEYKVIFSASSV